MSVHDPEPIDSEKEYVAWLNRAQPGDACCYYSYSLHDFNDMTLGAMRNLGRFSVDVKHTLALADRVLKDSTANVNVGTTWMPTLGPGRGLVHLLSRKANGRRELLAVRTAR